MKTQLFLFLAAAVATSACGSADDDKGTPPEEGKTYQPGVTVEADRAVFTTGEYELEPGQEKFLCFTTTVDEDLTIETVGHDAPQSLHHVIFAKTSVPEPDGYSECDTLFRLTWEPVYLAGAGKSELSLPDGYAHRIPRGTQLLAQLHLLNTRDEAVRDSVQITMTRATVAEPKPVAVYAFGNMSVNLPARQKSSMEGNCDVKEDIHLLAGFPHMHMLGRGLTFDVTRAGGANERAFERTPYNFDDQRLDAIDVTLKAGDQTKVTCQYDNPYDHAISFGESTMNEMCFFVAIAADRDKIGGCIENVVTSP
jgi:hypothetical protein